MTAINAFNWPSGQWQRDHRGKRWVAVVMFRVYRPKWGESRLYGFSTALLDEQLVKRDFSGIEKANAALKRQMTKAGIPWKLAVEASKGMRKSLLLEDLSGKWRLERLKDGYPVVTAI